MDNSIIRKAESILEQRRFASKLNYNTKLNTVYSENPILEQLEKERRAFACNLTLSKEERSKKSAEAKAKIEKFVKDNNISLPVEEHFCTKCNDLGYLPSNERCSCFTKIIIEESLKDDAIGFGNSFDNFDIDIFEENNKQRMLDIKNFCEQYSKKFPNVKKRNVVFCGGTGTGKTFLLSCVATALREKGLSVVFITAGKLFDILRKYAFDKISDIDALFSCDMLIIDDLGSEPVFNNITVEYIFMLINERTRTNKPICISTNLMPNELEKRYTERITSRIFDKSATEVIKLIGVDLRMRQK